MTLPFATPERPACYVCGGGAARVLAEYRAPDRYEQAMALDAAGYLRRWFACDDCGFHYSASSRAEALQALYATAYREERVQQVSLRQRFEAVVGLPYVESENKQRVAGLKRLLAEAEWLVARRGVGRRRVLDIGGGTGVFLYEFLDSEWEGFLVEPSPAACAFVGATVPGVRVAESYFIPGLFGCAFHLVTLIQTLEHVEDPLTVLRGVRRELEPDGLVFVESPDSANFACLPVDHDIFASPHRFLFDPGALVTLASRAGLQPLVVARQLAVRGHVNVSCLASRDDVVLGGTTAQIDPERATSTARRGGPVPVPGATGPR